MSEDNIRRLTSRKFILAALMLVALVGIRAFDLIDGAQFMVGYLSLGAGYFGVNLAARKASA
jgi:hypothetical protein